MSMFTESNPGVPPLATFVEAAGRVVKKLFACELTQDPEGVSESESIVARVPLAPAGLTMMELRMPRNAAKRLAELWTGEAADDEMAGDAVRELAETIAAVGYRRVGGVTRCGRVSSASSAFGTNGVACSCEAGAMWLGFAGAEA